MSVWELFGLRRIAKRFREIESKFLEHTKERKKTKLPIGTAKVPRVLIQIQDIYEYFNIFFHFRA